ncbi:hypothetical protein K469DRAFT_747760 [Zopfia rhizophila CBS 207.26]|uniref:Uncharacterized protein n=1 Tax=Zopfia rhizophila CBS 207.26 TaxID=1314779 RepID=A0A6A6EGS0_9PEZI|nr:hypothetical protein K469DRAFT_747760 [Zopfia rhizophila CBS 207.26]
MPHAHSDRSYNHNRQHCDSNGYSQAPSSAGTSRTAPNHNHAQSSHSASSQSSQQYAYLLPHSSTQGPTQQQNNQYWHPVPRSWQTENPEAWRATLQEALNYPSTSNSNYIPTNHHHQTHQANPHQQQANSLSSSNLQQLNAATAATSNIAMWMNESQRDGAWDGAGWVLMEEGRGGNS